MSRSYETKLTILDTALGLVRKLGFESVSIACLANEVGMSKSGLFAHFNSKEKMHVMILDHAAQSFSQAVFVPALNQPRGLPRLHQIMKNWIDWYGGQKGGCPFIAAAVEYDAKPGIVKERVQMHLGRLMHSLSKSVQICIAEEHFYPETDTNLVAYQIYSLVMGYLVYKRTLDSQVAQKYFKESLDQLLDRNIPDSL